MTFSLTVFVSVNEPGLVSYGDFDQGCMEGVTDTLSEPQTQEN